MVNSPSIILNIKRDNFLDEQYYGSYYLYENNKKVLSKGFDDKTIVFMRSLAKPLQASISADYNIINDFNLKDDMLAIFQGSHSGSLKHIKLLEDILKKYKIKKSWLNIKPQVPLDIRNFNSKPTKLHNNCSAKHIFMVLNSMYLGFDIGEYINPNSKLQKLILKKQNELSNYKSDILTFDGCGTPLWGLPVKNLINAYFNYFNNPIYFPLINSVIKNPYIFGGYDRLDTEIIQKSKGKLYSKVGAGGFVLVYNFSLNAILLLKMTQNNNPIRRLIVLNMLNELNWLKTEIEYDIFNQQNKKVAKYCYEFEM